MLYTQSLAVTDFGPIVNRPMWLERRLFLCLLPCCFVMAAVPLASLRGTVAAKSNVTPARLAAAADVLRKKSTSAGWTPAINRELAARWRSGQSREQIALKMGVSPAAVRNRATMLGLYPRSRGSLIAF
jgi:hypothetical protein